MSDQDFPRAEESAEVGAVSEPLPSKACLEFNEFTVKAEPDQVYRVEVWHRGDALPLYSQPGYQDVDAAMLAGLIWLKAYVLEEFTCIQLEIDKRTP